jgi:hypothetical protein
MHHAPLQLPDNAAKERNRRRISFDLANYRRILLFRNLHKGEQCVVLATGPSINEVDLSLLKDHPCVLGVNGAYRIRRDLKYYFCSCPNFYLSNQEDIETLPVERFFFSSHVPYRQKTDRVYLKLHEHTRLFAAGRFQPNLLKTLYWGPTVLLDLVIPVVLWMGFSEVVLLGADYSLAAYRHFYSEDQHKVLCKVDTEHEMVLAHEGFRVLAKYLRKSSRPVRIVNCSPSSDLKHLESAKLEDMLRRRAHG